MIPKRIAAIGASYCEGKVDPEGGGFVGRLRSWHESFIQDNHVFNLGISGDTTSDMLKRLEKEMKVPYVDVFGEFMKIDYKKYLADGLHPNSQGHQRIFELVKDKLIGVYGKN